MRGRGGRRQTKLDWPGLPDSSGNFGSAFGTRDVFRSRIPEVWKRDFSTACEKKTLVEKSECRALE